MRKRDLVVVGASAGGVQALCALVHELPPDFAGAVLVVMHIGRTSALPEILSRCGPLAAVPAETGEVVRHGRIYVAAPDQHLVLRDGCLELTRAARENRSRPAIDPLFRSAARIYRSRVIGILLTGALDDGTAGLFAVKTRGGLTIVQEPAEAQNPSMPLNALQHVAVDHCLPLKGIGALLRKLVPCSKEKVGKPLRPPPARARERNRRGREVPFSCPDCSGPMFLEQNGKLMSFHCDVGHRYSPESLTEAHGEALERAIWIAIRTLRERSAIQRALAAGKATTKDPIIARFESVAASADRDAELLQEILKHL